MQGESERCGVTSEGGRDVYYERGRAKRVCVFITGESESQNKEKQIWSYEERR